MSKRILVVEDQEDLRGMLRDVLSGTGFTVSEAENGERGVTKAESERPDLISWISRRRSWVGTRRVAR